MLVAGLYSKAVARRLTAPLSRTEEALLLSFVEDHYGQPCGDRCAFFAPFLFCLKDKKWTGILSSQTRSPKSIY